MSSKFLAFTALITVATLLVSNMSPATGVDVQFEEFKTTHGKTYSNAAEESYRKSVFLMNLAKISVHNADKTQTHKLGVTQFSDLTQDEFVKSYLTTKVNPKFSDELNRRTANPTERNGDIDWTRDGKVSPVKNQANCGSCWAFSAVGAIESAYLLAGQTLNLAEQQLVDCSRAYGNQGCNGGWMDSAFKYVIEHGLVSTSDYPYTARDQVCAKNEGSYKIAGFVDVPGCDNLLNALSGRPVSVAVDASVWGQYKTGVISSCGANVNHGVLLVGYVNDTYKIKNSWGTGWGESGFVRLAKGNTCAICNYPSYPTL